MNTVNVTALHSYFDEERNLCVTVVKIEDNYKPTFELDYYTREGEFIDHEEIDESDVREYLKN